VISKERRKQEVRKSRKRYCVNGHDTWKCGRRKSNNCCLACGQDEERMAQFRMYKALYFLAFPDKIRSNSRKSRLKYVDERRKACRIWHRNNPEWRKNYARANQKRIAKQARKWRNQPINKQKHCENSRRYRRQYPERVRKTKRLWSKKNPGKKSATNAKREALKRLVTIGDLTKIAKIYIRASELRQQGFNVQVDHIIPLAKGGAHSPENLQIISAYENGCKSDSLTYKVKKVFH
jgi:hypothetical protein